MQFHKSDNIEFFFSPIKNSDKTNNKININNQNPNHHAHRHQPKVTHA
jgi:hypothetical protein